MGVLSLTVIALNNNMCFIFLLLLAAQMEIKRACVPKTHLYTQLNTIPIDTRPINNTTTSYRSSLTTAVSMSSQSGHVKLAIVGAGPHVS